MSLRSTAYDADLYHRALTGRGDPIRSEEIIALLESLEDQSELESFREDNTRLEKEVEKLEGERDQLERDLEASERRCEALEESLAKVEKLAAPKMVGS